MRGKVSATVVRGWTVVPVRRMPTIVGRVSILRGKQVRVRSARAPVYYMASSGKKSFPKGFIFFGQSCWIDLAVNASSVRSYRRRLILLLFGVGSRGRGRQKNQRQPRSNLELHRSKEEEEERVWYLQMKRSLRRLGLGNSNGRSATNESTDRSR
jgi:hypothetical protein